MDSSPPRRSVPFLLLENQREGLPDTKWLNSSCTGLFVGSENKRLRCKNGKTVFSGQCAEQRGVRAAVGSGGRAGAVQVGLCGGHRHGSQGKALRLEEVSPGVQEGRAPCLWWGSESSKGKVWGGQEGSATASCSTSPTPGPLVLSWPGPPRVAWAGGAI